MTDKLSQRRTDDGYEFLADDVIVGRLVWIERASEEHSPAGWWLIDVPGKLDEALYRVPQATAEDLDAARAQGESASLWFAHTITSDYHSGLINEQQRDRQ